MHEKEQKIELRRTLLALRDAVAGDEKAAMDAAICGKIEAVIKARNAKVIHSYIPFGSEVDIRPLLQYLLDSAYTVVCPRSLPKRSMQNLVLHSLSELEEGRFGTMYPANSTEYTGAIDLFIVPGIGFDRPGHRLGYGAGYYDTFFAAHPDGYRLGICYPFQVIDSFPTEPHDVPMDQVLLP